MRKPRGDATPDEVRTARALNKWYPQAHDAAVALWTRGISGPEISEILWDTFGLKKSKSAVIGRMFRAGLAYEGPPSNGPGKGCRRGGKATNRRRAFMSAAALERVRERDRLRKRKQTPAAPRAPKPGRLVAQAWDGEGGSSEPTPFAPRAPKPKRAGPAEVRESLRIPIWEIREGQCRFIADDPLVNSTMCGHQALAGSAWCSGHHAICCEGSRRASAPQPTRRLSLLGFRRSA